MEEKRKKREWTNDDISVCVYAQRSLKFLCFFNDLSQKKTRTVFMLCASARENRVAYRSDASVVVLYLCAIMRWWKGKSVDNT